MVLWTNNVGNGWGRGVGGRAAGVTRWWRTGITVALGCALLATAGYIAVSYAQEEKAQAMEAWRARLTAMAVDRAEAVSQWVADGHRAAQSLAACGVVRHALGGPAQALGPAGHAKGMAGSVQAVLDAFVRTESYRSAYLVTEAGTPLAASAGSLPFDDACLSAARDILAGGKGSAEFHFHANGSPLVAFAATVPGEGVPQRDAARPAAPGVVVLESDPHAWLYPILAREPTFTATGETTLVGREGTDIVFLNPPRQAGARPIGLRVRTGSSTIAALETSRGFYARVDSRGVPVLAATNPVVGAPWSIVVKIDESEALGPYRRELRNNALALSGILLFLAAAGSGLWRERRFAYEKVIARGQARLSLVLDHANDAILFLAPDGRVLDANRAALSAYGYSKDELCELTMHDLCGDGMSADSCDRMKASAARDGFVAEAIHRRKDGTSFPVEVSSRAVRLDDEEVFLAIVRDITERKRAEDRYRRLVEAAPDVVFSISAADFTITALNPAFEKITGWSREEWIGKPFAPLIHPDDLELAEETLRQALSGISLPPYELRVLAKSGAYLVGEFTNAPEIENGVVVGVFGIVRDITERKRAEDVLRESEERYRTLVDSLAEGVAIIDLEARVMLSNPAHDRMLGVPTGALVGRNLMEFVAPESLAVAWAQTALVRDGKPTTFEVDVVRPSGERRSVVISIQPLLDGHGRAVSAVGISRDITERRRAEQQIRMLAHSLRSIGECVSITDRDDNILFVNEAFRETYGYTEEELVGQPVTILRPPGEVNARTKEILGATLAGGWRGEIINRRKDGSEFPISLSTSVVRDDAGSPIGLVGVATDLTERKRLEEQFLRAQRMETVGALAGGMAHDFNNMMQGVLSHAQLLLTHPEDPERVRARVREIQEQVAHGASLTRQLLLFSRREVVKPERLDLNALVRTTADFLHHLIRENVTVQLDLVSSPLPIQADRGQLEQVIINLAVNASEAMPAGGQLTLATDSSEDGGVQLIVRDTGRGIAEAIRASIFEPFVSTKHASEGAGLGLAVVYGIVSKHGGSIAVESEVGKGTTFRISLPRKISGEFAAVPETVVASEGSGEGHGERVLLVEDEAAVREGLIEMLTMLGYEVVAVGSGEAALALPSQPPFRVLLTDLLLPGISGAEVAKRLAPRWPEIEVIVMSGYAQDEAVRRGVIAGVVRFLQKPFGMDTLERELHAALSDKANDRSG